MIHYKHGWSRSTIKVRNHYYTSMAFVLFEIACWVIHRRHLLSRLGFDSVPPVWLFLALAPLVMCRHVSVNPTNIPLKYSCHLTRGVGVESRRVVSHFSRCVWSWSKWYRLQDCRVSFSVFPRPRSSWTSRRNSIQFMHLQYNIQLYTGELRLEFQKESRLLSMAEIGVIG